MPLQNEKAESPGFPWPFPAVTTTVQTSMLTGVSVAEHGIVGNGWYDRTEGEVKFWKQSQKFVEAEAVWQKARRIDSKFTCANVCWWYAMNSDVDVYVTPRPIYRANGRKVPDCQTRPSGLRDELTEAHGPFPLFKFWGPGADIESTRWIVDAAIHVAKTSHPTLQLVYLPHLDYGFRNSGPDTTTFQDFFERSMQRSDDSSTRSRARASMSFW